ncbi:MAG: FAD/NAD(P)-binding protein, partial [Myxococcota bacterium]
LGMNRAITRRDFLGGVSMAIASSALPASARATSTRADTTGVYAPALTGLRGSHRGSFEVAHQMAFAKRVDWGTATEPDGLVYDLVVVGAGVSGLAAAFFYREQHKDARILLLDNHDDFGGHAKRNEFRIGDQTILGYGGSQSLESPSDYSSDAKGLLAALGVDIDRFYDYYDRDFYRDHELATGTYFDRPNYGTDKLVIGDFTTASQFLGFHDPKVPIEQMIGQMPISDEARRQFAALLKMNDDRIPDVSVFREPGFLAKISYLEFVRDHLGIRDAQVLGILQDVPSSYYGLGIDGVSAMNGLMMGMPGLGGTSMRWVGGLVKRLAIWSSEPYIFHFPDGNASIPRLLVRSLIPGVAPGSTMEDIVESGFDYAKLDEAGERVRLRLNSTVVRVTNEGAPARASSVSVRYVRDGRTYRVNSRNCVLACYNMVIPYLCPELPAEQSTALAQLVKTPLVYTNVLLRNWKPWKRLGLGYAHCPGSYHTSAMIDFPVSIGGYQFSRSPEEPVIAQLMRVPSAPGFSQRDQYRRGQAEILNTSYESIERDTRTQLLGMLGPGGFDPQRDIAAITVNRWPHGYAYEHNALFDRDHQEAEHPWVIGRQRFGRIAIANSDAGGRAYLDCAIDQARRAVNDLS